jgi:hypothetical protein
MERAPGSWYCDVMLNFHILCLSSRSSYTNGSWKTSARREEENKAKRKEEEDEKERSKRREQEKRRKESSSSSSDSEPEASTAETAAPEAQPAAAVLTETELNALAAKLVKAELLGNEEQVREVFFTFSPNIKSESLLTDIFSNTHEIHTGTENSKHI